MYMRKVIIALLALPFMATAQDKTVVSVNRVFPKGDKVQAFEKALAAHAQKYHKGDVAWRVFTIESGPDAGGYHITEGPKTWDAVDKRGDLGAEHTADYDKNVQPYLQERSSNSFAVYRADLSSVPLTQYSDKINITHVYQKMGYGADVEDMIKKLKKTWDESKQSVAVYESSSSGEPQYILVTRYMNGLKEREMGFRAPMKERYEKANGAGSWDGYMQSLRTSVDRIWSELLFFKADLSSK
jgi:hypothetical protein